MRPAAAATRAAACPKERASRCRRLQVRAARVRLRGRARAVSRRRRCPARAPPARPLHARGLRPRPARVARTAGRLLPRSRRRGQAPARRPRAARRPGLRHRPSAPRRRARARPRPRPGGRAGRGRCRARRRASRSASSAATTSTTSPSEADPPTSSDELAARHAPDRLDRAPDVPRQDVPLRRPPQPAPDLGCERGEERNEPAPVHEAELRQRLRRCRLAQEAAAAVFMVEDERRLDPRRATALRPLRERGVAAEEPGADTGHEVARPCGRDGALGPVQVDGSAAKVEDERRASGPRRRRGAQHGCVRLAGDDARATGAEATDRLDEPAALAAREERERDGPAAGEAAGEARVVRRHREGAPDEVEEPVPGRPPLRGSLPLRPAAAARRARRASVRSRRSRRGRSKPRSGQSGRGAPRYADDERRAVACEGPSRRAGRARLLGPEAEQHAEAERIGELLDGGARLGHLDGGGRAERKRRGVGHLIHDR